MKILFLDIDGVLNNKGMDWTIAGPWTISDDAVELLNKLMDDIPDLNIVLSTSWRIVVGEKNTVEHLVKHGFRHAERVIGSTPRRETVWERGDECLDWINFRPIGMEDIHNFVILDDEKDFFITMINPEHRKHLVLTNKKVGLTQRQIAKIKEILCS